MAKGQNQKQKLLYLAKIFSEKTDEAHGLTMPQLIAALEAYGVAADRKTLYLDMEELRQFGMDILPEKDGSKTLEMTRVGQYLERTNAPMEQWKAASSCFARVASITNTQVYSVQSCTGVKITSVWATVEYPLLSLSNKTTNYCVVRQDGIIKFLKKVGYYGKLFFDE